MVLNDAKSQQIDIQGHRGARGLLPENTIPAFLRALDEGVTTVELDLAVTADDVIIVSHEPYFSGKICLDPSGNEIKKGKEKDHNIFAMTYEEVKRYDCGSLGNPDYPEQEKMALSKPSLEEVIKAVERHVKGKSHYEVDYNIELKSSPEGDGIYHPNPQKFSDLVYNLLNQYLPWERVVIQSFDFRVLRYWNEKYPEVRLAALIEKPGAIDKQLEELGFKPDIYSPYFKFLSKEKVKELHKQGIKVIPWTVNEKDDMKELVEMKVDGLITDYPNRATELGLTLKKNTEEE